MLVALARWCAELWTHHKDKRANGAFSPVAANQIEPLNCDNSSLCLKSP
jgi:hypothetical protein